MNYFKGKKRSQEESRADDSVFEKRLGIYKQSHTEITNSLSEFYEVINIDANNEIPLISQKITNANYKKSNRGKELKKVSDQKYHQSKKGKIILKKALKKYSNSEKGKEMKKVANKKYKQSEKGIKSNKIYQKSDKAKATRSRYFKKRRQIDPIFQIKDNCRTRLERFLKSKKLPIPRWL